MLSATAITKLRDGKLMLATTYNGLFIEDLSVTSIVLYTGISLVTNSPHDADTVDSVVSVTVCSVCAVVIGVCVVDYVTLISP